MSGRDAFVETVDIDELARHEAAWRDLASRAAEPNPFCESAFLLPALRRLAPSRVTVALAWRDPRRGELIGLVAPREPPLGLGLARIWRNKQTPLAAMLFDRDAMPEALTALVASTRGARPFVAGLVWPGVETDGVLARALRALAARDHLRIEAINPHRRATLVVAGAARFEAELDKKRRKEWGRQGRRLAERGQFEARVVADGDGVERFLALEGLGWKGARGTALNANPARLAFAREMLAAFRVQGRLQIHELALDGAAIASGIVIRAGARAYYWKTAYDERLAEFSPGVQATLAISRGLADTPGLALADSCAQQDHPMIDRLWPGRLELADIALAIRPEGGRWLGAWLAGARAYSAARELAKSAVNQSLGRKRS